MSDPASSPDRAEAWLTPPRLADEQLDQRVSVAWWALLGGMCALLALFAVGLVVPEVQADRYMLAAAGLAALGLVGLRAGYYELATRGVVLGIAALVYALVLLRGGVLSDTAVLLPTVAALGALVVGPRMGGMLTVAGAALLVGTYTFGASTALVRPEDVPMDQTFTSLLLAIVVTGALAAFATHRGRVATEVAAARARSVTTANERLDAAYERIDGARRYSEAVVASMPEPVLLTDADGVIVLANAAARAALTDLANASLIGQSIAKLLPDGLDQAVIDAASGRAEGRVRALTGRELPMQVARAVLTDATSRGNQVWVLADLSHRLEAEARTAAAAMAAEDANRSKANFLANMSHELRTPLNAVIGYSEIVLEDLDDDGMRADVAKIHHAGQHLLTLINDVLDMSKIEAGRMEVHYEPIAVEPVLRDVVASVADAAEARGNRVEVQLAPDLGLLVTDGRRLQQILTNLLSNAVKFTENGEITLNVARTTMGVRLAVRDTGIGIAPDKLGALFRPFMQADSSSSRRYGGTGLGLALSQRLAELLGGRIDVRSTLGVGSTFTLHLPASARDTRPAVEPVLPESLVSGDGPLVLCVDDDLATLELLSRTLTREGFRVLTASNGPAALATLRISRPAVVTLDLMMPEMDGWSLLRQLKADPTLREIPVVVVSMVDQRTAGIALGASDYLVKPVQPGQLASTLLRVLER